MLQLFSALQEHGLNLLIANGFLDSSKGQPAVGNGLWNELAMCWLVWPGLNAAINSCRSGSQWEYGPWRNSVAVCGHFFWPIFGWLSRVLFLNWIKDSSRKMSTSTVWCKILLLDVFQICIFSFFFQNFGQACGWVGTETVHPNGKLQIPSICRLYAHQEENLNQNLLKMFDIF